MVRNPGSFQPFDTPACATLIWAVVAIPLWSALGWYAFGVAQRNPATWAVVAIAAWRLLRNLYVSARAIVDLIVPVTVTGTLLSLRHNGPGPQEQEEALGGFTRTSAQPSTADRPVR
jgi:hypothetical protein